MNEILVAALILWLNIISQFKISFVIYKRGASHYWIYQTDVLYKKYLRTTFSKYLSKIGSTHART